MSSNHDNYPINTILVHRVTRQQYKVVCRTPDGLITLTSQGGKSEFVYIKNAELHIYTALMEAA